VALDGYDYARALERVESFFWSFCDDYVELVKIRAYGENDSPATRSARAALSLALSVLQRLLAPFLPFVTDEVWHWWHTSSVHLAAWPSVDELGLGSVTTPGSIYFRSARCSRRCAGPRARPRSPSAPRSRAASWPVRLRCWTPFAGPA